LENGAEMNEGNKFFGKKAFIEIATAIFSLLVTLVVFLNFASEIIAGIWLAILGDWKSIGAGLLMSIGMPWAYFLITLPSMGLGYLLIILIKKGKKIPTTILGFVNMIYTNAIIAFWVVLVFAFFMDRVGGRSNIPYLVWGYGTTMAPLSYMASKDRPEGSPASTLALVFAQLCYSLCALFYFLAKNRTPWLLYSLTICVVGFSMISTILTLDLMQKEKQGI
jgi:hypothetical protein